MTKTCTIFLLSAMLIGASTWMSPIEFDSAFNFQIANSLLHEFSYQSTYIPTKIYHHQITTNGPLQYIMALCIGLFGLDLGQAFGLGAIGGLCAVAIYHFSPYAFALYCLLLFFWPLFASSHNAFCGEILTITLIIHGLTHWERWCRWSAPPAGITPIADKPNRTWRNLELWTTGLAFGTAIATKFIAAGVIPLLLFCLFFHARRHSPPKTATESLALFSNWFVLPMVIALAFFLLQFALSIIHSGGTVASILPTLQAFIGEHLHQANKAKSVYDLQHIYLQPYEIPVIITLIAALALLLVCNRAFALPAVCILLLLFIVHLNLRRMLPLIVPVMLLAAKISASPSPSRVTPPAREVKAPLLLSFAGLILISGYLVAHTPLYLLDTLRQFSWSGAPRNIAIVTKRTTYNDHLILLLQKLDGPVFTSRWWQFPEISLRTGTAFYDRFAPENSALLDKRHGYLLFSSQNTEDLATEKTLCGTILFRDRDLILCEYRPSGQ